MDANTTALQNLVIAYNQNTKSSTNVAGEVTSITYIGPTQVVVNTGACRLVNVSLVVAGGGNVNFYNSQALVALPANSLLYVLPSTATVGITQVGLQFSSGLIIDVPAGVSINCTYSITRS
jgi:hypothetical protein